MGATVPTTRMRRVVLSLTLVIAGAVLVDLTSTFAGAAGVVPPHDPIANVSAIPAFNFVAGQEYVVGSKLAPCWRWIKNQIAPDVLSLKCVLAEVRATNHAHRLEHIASVSLPRNFQSLRAAEQLLVLVDLERVSRGEPPVLGLSKAADGMAQLGAKKNQDPSLTNRQAIPGATGSWLSNWAAASGPLDANYSWMYLDGWAGKNRTSNFTCTSAHATGCWGHRNNILVNSPALPCYATHCALVMGAGEVPVHWGIYDSYSELIVQVAGSTPPLIYTWKQAVAGGARA